MAVLSDEDVAAVRNWYANNRERYERTSDHIYSQLVAHKGQNPKAIRVVFSRVPKVKTEQSAIEKIASARDENPNYGIQDLSDMIGLTVLCAYRSDVQEFVKWLKGAFDPLNSDEDALRASKAGHRALHYIVSVKQEVAVAHADFHNVRCEIQIKTVLEEAFDAKSHDIVYKSTKKVSDQLKIQFATLSSALYAFDEQSEFLKDLIIAEEKELLFRRLACLQLFLRDEETIKVATKLGVEIDGEINALTLAQKLKPTQDVPLSPNFCELAALCAIMSGNAYIRSVALDFADQYFGGSTEPKAILGGAYIKWTLGLIEDAIRDCERAISLATAGSPTHIRAKNNFAYFVADHQCVHGRVHEQWKLEACNYLAELFWDESGRMYRYRDTVGFFLVVFGECRDAILAGWEMLRNAATPDTSQESVQFSSYHEYLALRRLLAFHPAS